jgi:NAD(P)-dependent dehydrogenase (short-subunit alcohol dehydrogenase family)
MDLKLDSKVALVSGSTAGIGYAIAETLAAEGARVIVNGRTQRGVDEAIAAIRKSTGKQALGFAGDLSTASAADALVAAHPGIEILVNNLGIFEATPFEHIPDDDWRRFFEVNVLSGARLARMLLPAMRKADWGRIIFISSESGVHIPAEMVHYGMTKAAQIAVARGIAETVAGTGITVNSVLPGPTRDPSDPRFADFAKRMGKANMEEAEAEFINSRRPTSLIKRFARPEEVAAMIAYVASPLSSATTGSALRVDGGVVKSAY